MAPLLPSLPTQTLTSYIPRLLPLMVRFRDFNKINGFIKIVFTKPKI